MTFKKIISALIVGAFSIASFVGYFPFPSVNNITVNADDTLIGDANQDGKLDISDSSFIMRMLSRMKTNELPVSADYNQDGSINTKDVTAIANHLVKSFSNSDMSLDEYISNNTSNLISRNSDKGSLSVRSMEGRPGEVVTLAIIAKGSSIPDSFDILVKFDPKLEAYSVCCSGAMYSASDIGEEYVAIVGYSSNGIGNGIISTIDFKIPNDAKEGDTYNIDIPVVNTYALYEGADIAEIVPVYGGTITVKGSPVEEPQPLDYEMDTPGIGLSSAVGEPGQTVKIGVYVSCNNDFKSLDSIIVWDDTSLTASKAKAIRVRNMGGCASDTGTGYCTIVRYCDVKGALVDGAIATIDFTIPEYARPGKEYELIIGRIDTFTAFDDIDVASSVSKYGGTITVVAPPPPETIPVVTTPVQTTETTLATATVVSEDDKSTGSTTATTTSPTATTTISEEEPYFAKNALDMVIGDISHLKVNNYQGDIKWTSSNEIVAVVDSNGTVTAVGEGNALIIATIGKTYLTCEVNVEKSNIISIDGDANNDGKLNVRDAAYIAKMLAMGKTDELPTASDFNGDGKVNVRDAAAIAKFLATGKK